MSQTHVGPVHMVAIDDDARIDIFAIVDGAHDARLATIEGRSHGVVEVGRKANTVIEPGHGLIVTGGSVTGRDQNARFHQTADMGRLVAFRCQGDLGDGIRVGAEEVDHLVRWLANLRGRVDPLALEVGVRPFQMDAQHLVGVCRHVVTGHRNGLLHIRIRTGDQGRQEAGGTGFEVGRLHGCQGLDRDLGVEHHTATAVELHVDKTGGQVGAFEVNLLDARRQFSQVRDGDNLVALDKHPVAGQHAAAGVEGAVGQCVHDDSLQTADVGGFQLLEVANGLDLELHGGGLVAHHHSLRMQLQGGDGPHVVDAAFYGGLQGQCLAVTGDQDHDLFRIHQGADTHGQRQLGHLLHVAAEEAGVGDTGIFGQGLDPGAGGEGRGRFVECDVAVVTHAPHEQVDLAVGLDFVFVALALGHQILGIAVEDVDVFGTNVDVTEEVVVHEAVVALRVIFRQADVLVHVEGDHVLEAHFTGFVQLDQALVGVERGATGGQAQYERAIAGRLERVDAVNDVTSRPQAYLAGRFQRDQAHMGYLCVGLRPVWRWQLAKTDSSCFIA
ncbi:conserved hypothetical protein [Aeromonas veronii]|uniref:Uncharacterized protein n=1 Tax=Aeromonas veronii TaxID=654 RepID=A0A653KT99_AERVE|nr:conserved hypothetical protein [Aeromonas veronii]